MTDLAHTARRTAAPDRDAADHPTGDERSVHGPDGARRRRLDAWSRWLVGWCAVVGAISLATVVVRQVSGELFNLALFGATDTPTGFTDGAVDYQRFIWGVTGATTIGWMLLAIPVARGPLRRGERWAWGALATSFAGWFVIDGALSIALGFAENVAVNVLFVIGVVPALVATRPGRR